ncbi:MAG: hypothetical protein C4586_00840 [Anaerolineaceae bacterium]|nr:MAG: hypothetical protein C4586_00840 [Anaerolineaceae bacterium]
MKRPFPVTLTLWLVLITITWNILRVWTSIAWNNVLIKFSASLPPAISAFIGGIWVVTGLVICWGIWQGRVWAGKMLFGAAAGYTVWYWSERFFFHNQRSNTIFAVIVNLGLLIPIFFATKSLSREAHEREFENPKVE